MRRTARDNYEKNQMQNLVIPLVSIGVPVYNGEKLISRALSALIEQDYANIEIIISDNGSTDNTQKICKEFAEKDTRVRYYRSDKNLGSSWNFNRVFELSNGKYFMWAAHDDLRKISFVKSCVEKLEQSPESVLCQAKTAVFIEHKPNSVYTASLDSFSGLTDPIQRYRETLKNFPATAIYGLYRREAMMKTRLFEKVIATDLAFIQELSIYGSFSHVDEELFFYVVREQWNTVQMDYTVFTGKERKPFWYLPFVVLFLNNWSRVSSSSAHRALKFRFFGELLKYQIKQVILKLCIKLIGKICPTIWKDKLGCGIYWRFMSNPNVKVEAEEMFLERIIKPQLGWWPR